MILPAEPLYSAGDCPACPGFCDQFFVKARATGRLFVMCPACGSGNSEPYREGGVIEPVADVSTFAPGRQVTFPTRQEIVAAFSELAIVREYPYERWEDYFFVGGYLDT